MLINKRFDLGILDVLTVVSRQLLGYSLVMLGYLKAEVAGSSVDSNVDVAIFPVSEFYEVILLVTSCQAPFR
jgi:hypothetical protein